ncbi:hypothetical protein EHS25_007121 [Saitozyma podzolica]|uniref:Major facilitator superfamily (MFS) profile domain-containing protein n=1 Tax=Saitozyma podzolica TaxID=1890683 RepID=A0A427XPM7_9TREE|nr:hypothetical protein EHS25_007121 [Saitozyma podzolica]
MTDITPARDTPVRESDLDEKFDNPSQLEHGYDDNAAKHLTDREGAIAAESAEQQMTFKEAIRDYPAAVFWSFAISLCIIMEGYDTALPGNFVGIPAFRERFGEYVNAEVGYQLTPAWQSGLGQCSGVGSILAIFAAAWFQQRYGYRRVIQVGLVAMFCFIFIVFFAQNIIMLAIGYHLCGWAWGTFQASVVSYASEITPVALRGYLTTYVNLCWIIGQFLAAGVLKAMADRTDEWAYRIPFAVQWVWPIPLIILIHFAPESPWFLVRAGRLDEAAKSVARIQKKGSKVDPKDAVAMMVRTNEHEMAVSAGATYWDCFKGSDLRRTEIACVAWASQTLCGLGFAGQFVYFLQQAGVSASDSFSFNLGSVAMGFVGTILSWFIMNRFGRRTMMVWGSFGLTALLVLLGILTIPARTSSGAKWAQAVLMLIWVLIFDLSVGPLAYCIVGEVSSTRLRGLTVGLARNAYNILGIPIGVLLSYQLNPTAWNWGGYTGFFWAGSGLLVSLWVFFRLPECKGRSFRELDILFERGVSARKFASTKIEAYEES